MSAMEAAPSTLPANRIDEALGIARQLVTALESGQNVQAEHLVDQLSSLRDSQLFQELGRLTRTLHDTLTSVQMDPRLARLTEQEMPDVRERLQYVVKKTEQAANRTLQAVEEGMPIATHLTERAASHKADWDRFLRREMDVNEFRHLTRTLSAFLGEISEDAAELRKHLSEVLMAQEFQDLTGQVIQRVIKVVTEVEDSLVEMIRVVGKRGGADESHNKKDDLEGPQINADGRADVVSTQDDVDDLLSSLGF
jgi:chemotaxis protein CheZ